MKTISIQPANTPSGEYDVTKPRAYPFYILADGKVDRQDFWQGDPLALIGFQNAADVQHVDVMLAEFLADPQIAVGKFPVFVKSGGGFWNYTCPISDVTVIGDES